MYSFAFLLKTYEKDYKYAKRLLESYAKHNCDSIPCFVVLPKETKLEFMNSLDREIITDVTFLDEQHFPYLVEKNAEVGVPSGYLNQEIIKLSFWEEELCENYCCLDSDAVFIRDFYTYDFMYDEKTPYSVLMEDNDLKADPYYYQSFWIEREKALRRIQNEIGYNNKKLLTCHGFQNLSGKVLCDFKKNFMEVKGYNYIDLMNISPYEFTWYNIWLQKSKIIDIHICEPLFKTFHMQHQLYTSWLLGIDIEDLRRSYVGIVINSNFCNDKLINYDNSKEHRKKVTKFMLYLFWQIFVKN